MNGDMVVAGAWTEGDEDIGRGAASAYISLTACRSVVLSPSLV